MGWAFVLVLLFAVGCTSSADGAPVWTVPEQTPQQTVEQTVEMPPESVATDEPTDCADAADDMSGDRLSRPEAFWAEDEQVRGALSRVLERMSDATGLPLGMARGGVEAIVLDLPPGYLGFARGDHIEIDADVAEDTLDLVMLHELGHMLGAGHLGPSEGVMSRCGKGARSRLTSADLMQICSAAPCARFQPEVP